jgi:hypothetical protein
MPSISLSGVSNSLCRNTDGAAYTMSSGITKSRPLMAAIALAALSNASDARGDAPKKID